LTKTAFKHPTASYLQQEEELVNHDVRLQSIHQDYLKAAYDLGELKDKNGVTPQEILELLDLSEETSDRVLGFLVNADLVVWPAKGKLLLTEIGLEKAEELKRTLASLVIGSSPKAPLPLLCQGRLTSGLHQGVCPAL
jgi:5'-3' exonuclease